ncbi:hypothetical protein B566_EDAN016010 [Ephemera danica]|nr:hypothetical protein B566_EDAN016010 [Ephemera danica]
MPLGWVWALPPAGEPLGNEAFLLRPYLTCPYLKSKLTFETRVYNYQHNRARRIIENAFGTLASRWRLFRQPIIAQPRFVANYVKACDCLHNFIRGEEQCDKKTLLSSPFFEGGGRKGWTEVVPCAKCDLTHFAIFYSLSPFQGQNIQRIHGDRWHKGCHPFHPSPPTPLPLCTSESVVGSSVKITRSPALKKSQELLRCPLCHQRPLPAADTAPAAEEEPAATRTSLCSTVARPKCLPSKSVKPQQPVEHGAVKARSAARARARLQCYNACGARCREGQKCSPGTDASPIEYHIRALSFIRSRVLPGRSWREVHAPSPTALASLRQYSTAYQQELVPGGSASANSSS